MFRTTACKQLTYAAAILGLALLCAQTLVVVHDHQIAEVELCAVCSTTAEHAASSEFVLATETHPVALSVPAPKAVPPVTAAIAAHQARAPPIV